MLGAAWTLFDTHGYQGTTIRDIARDASVAVGSVFTTFSSRGEILSEVIQARIEPLYAELDRVAPHLHGPTADRLRTMFAIHFAFEVRHTRLFLAHIAAAYDWPLPPSAQPMGRNLRLVAIMRDVLTRGVAEGDVDPAIDQQEVVDLLMAAYTWVYRLAAWNNADAPTMTAVMDRQIGLVASGFNPQSSPSP